MGAGEKSIIRSANTAAFLERRAFRPESAPKPCNDRVRLCPAPVENGRFFNNYRPHRPYFYLKSKLQQTAAFSPSFMQGHHLWGVCISLAYGKVAGRWLNFVENRSGVLVLIKMENPRKNIAECWPLRRCMGNGVYMNEQFELGR